MGKVEIDSVTHCWLHVNLGRHSERAVENLLSNISQIPAIILLSICNKLKKIIHLFRLSSIYAIDILKTE